MQAQTTAAELGFQRRSWAVQRVGWLVLAVWLLASATGVIGPEAAKTVLDAWLVSEFAGGSSAKKVEKMEEIDRRYHGSTA